MLLLPVSAAFAADPAPATPASPPMTTTPAAVTPAPVVFFDIAGPDMDKLKSFYTTAFAWDVDPSGAIKNAGFPGTLRKDPAAKVLYLGVPDVTAALARVTASGGAVVMPRFEVKGVVVIGLFTDPAGNVMGLVEMKDGKPVVP
jgi:predicted enzyme related to lactoylglutathione lyase